jgi:hypothetical protein
LWLLEGGDHELEEAYKRVHSLQREERGGERMEQRAVRRKLRRERRGGRRAGWYFAVTGSGTHIRRLLMERRTCGSGVRAWGTQKVEAPW